MYLFSRTGRLRPGNVRDGMTWALGITERVHQITGLNVRVWTPMLSPGIGGLRWTTFVEDLTQLDNANAKLMVDDGYIAELDRGAQYLDGNGVDDMVATVLHGNIDPNRNVQYAVVVQSAFAAGGITKGVEAGIEIAERATQLAGVPTAFLMANTGIYGGVAWITAAETLEELEQGEAKTNGDPSFISYIDEVASKVFRAEETTQSMFRRLV